MKGRRSLGIWGERIAADYLSQHGYSILEKNYRSPYGEVDLIAEINHVIVFVEVKTRSSTQYGHPEDAVTRSKREHIYSCAQAYLQDHPDVTGDWRIDVIAVARNRNGMPDEIVHFENIQVGIT